MKWFQLAFIVIIICQCRTETADDGPYARMHLKRNTHDCLFCDNRPCATCPKSQLNSFQDHCPPCLLPPCPPCVKFDDPSKYRSLSESNLPPTPHSGRSPTPPSALCTPGEIKARTDLLVRRVVVTLRADCFFRKRFALPPFRLADEFCPLPPQRALAFAREHLPELIGYLYENLLMSEQTFEPVFVLRRDNSNNVVVIANPGEIICRPYIVF